MNTQTQRNAQESYLRRGTARCPICDGSLIREHRRLVDRVRSLVTPVRRYRCDNFGCQWVGNIARKASGDPVADMVQDDESADGIDAPRPNVPASFIVHMVLVAAGVVFVVMYSSMEPTPRPHESGSATGSHLYEPVLQRDSDLATSR